MAANFKVMPIMSLLAGFENAQFESAQPGFISGCLFTPLPGPWLSAPTDMNQFMPKDSMENCF